MDSIDYRAFLRSVLVARQAANPRYSLRAFARALGMHHSMLLRVMRGDRNLSPKKWEEISAKLKKAEEE